MTSNAFVVKTVVKIVVSNEALYADENATMGPFLKVVPRCARQTMSPADPRKGGAPIELCRAIKATAEGQVQLSP